MPTIIERKGRYLARVRKDGYKPVAKTFTRKSDALTWARKVELDMESGRWKDKGDKAPTLYEAVKQYRKAVVPAMKGAASYGSILTELEGISMAGKPLDSVAAADVARWRDDMTARGLAAGTVVRRLGLLAGLMTWAHKERGWISHNPVHSVRKPRVNDSRDRVLTVEERRWLLAAARASRCEWLGDALEVLLESAMRRGELWGLTIADLDLPHNVLHLADTKNGCARSVPLTTTATQALTRLADSARRAGQAARDAGAKDAPAPGHERLIPVADPHGVSLAFRRVLQRARALYKADCVGLGLEPVKGFLHGVRLHDCRHTAVTRWAATGQLSVHELMAVSGHKTPAMLARYVNLKAQDLARKLNGIDQAATVL